MRHGGSSRTGHTPMHMVAARGPNHGINKGLGDSSGPCQVSEQSSVAAVDLANRMSKLLGGSSRPSQVNERMSKLLGGSSRPSQVTNLVAAVDLANRMSKLLGGSSGPSQVNKQKTLWQRRTWPSGLRRGLVERAWVLSRAVVLWRPSEEQASNEDVRDPCDACSLVHNVQAAWCMRCRRPRAHGTGSLVRMLQLDVRLGHGASQLAA
ncbi:hypothetical protein AMTR_s00011p00265070 [Amborella trichopoda]|uniref:Uncharacterized protein n=1 Tax=Amborella trichopoda TaxID=13333 RepID=W1NHW8_AMBTC|nr:hypothetical protein AMTR_s00011p00265070 [Amborella trichopoda]